ncbi:hypothetical protein ABE29_02025 [Cytobacillus firmus]|uniref:DUF5316 family protein n=1 Tax=Cytobacillus TaxID=2675230 RepID=UPI0001F44AF8|nr:DUF5316 family protein [Cytobacillus firmus]EFV74316.1 hypothetical protein HMPREF1013_05455 [Bacillus sp. 2_A_57_CT2]MBG9541624.1 hypothetical protein [Cytobacillus firmus]MBG9553525.1 hypothetical protein [Cytobacillus firmus]MBG9556699.1 hypothetical protein [Cytobacillus firmus]MBG9574308.1 hypothetical protein [Cytobacillus firmus]
MKYLAIGIVLSITGVLLSLGFWELSKAYLVTGAIGLFFLAISVLMSGSLVGTHRVRAGLEAPDSPDERKKRKRTSIGSVFIGLPNIITAFLLYFILN